MIEKEQKMGFVEAAERIGTGKPTWELKQMLKANDSGVARFMGGMDTVKDIEAIKVILKHREETTRKFKE